MRVQSIAGVLMFLSTIACTDSDADPEPASNAGAAAVEGDTAARRATAGRGGSAAGSAAAAGKGAGTGSGGAAAVGGGGPAPAQDAGPAPSQDAGPDDTDAAVSCEGEIVSGPDRCLQDDAFCYPLGDGRYCTGPSAPECPKNSTPIAKDAPCPARTHCFDQSESLRCATRLYTIDECEAAGGVALPDPGDGSLECPNDARPLGAIDGAGWDEGGLCCPAPKQCGARAGDTCSASEYCAYQPGQLCGQADAQATCQTRPSSCTGPSSPVCGCDQQTYQSACEANLAGEGVFSDEACK